jgi:hypothetical protein
LKWVAKNQIVIQVKLVQILNNHCIFVTWNII